MGAVQFFGREAVVSAYENRGIPLWALFSGRNMVYAGDDTELLEKILDSFEGSSATYTLAVYNNSSLSPNTITNKTENNGAFTFKLDKAERVTGVQRYTGAPAADPITEEINSLLRQEVKAVLQKRLGSIREPDEPKEESWTDILKDTLRTNPGAIVTAIGALKDLFTTGNVASLAPVAIGALTKPVAVAGQTLHSSEGVDIDQDRWETVLDRLEKADPDILIHLEQLATMAEREPAKYKMALSFLQ